MYDWAERELEHVRRVRKDRHLTPTAGALFECGAERDRLREALRGLAEWFPDEYDYIVLYHKDHGHGTDDSNIVTEPLRKAVLKARTALGETASVEE